MYSKARQDQGGAGAEGQPGQGASPGNGGEGAQQGKKEDVVDADFKEVKD